MAPTSCQSYSLYIYQLGWFLTSPSLMKAWKKTKSLNQPTAAKVGYGLPSYDALAELLPNSHQLLRGAKTELDGAAAGEQGRPAESLEPKRANKPNINHTYNVHHRHKRQPLHEFEDDPHRPQIANLQNKDVKNYHAALNKMAEDIIALRKQVVTLVAENRQLRTDLSLHQDPGQNLVGGRVINDMTKIEVSGLVDFLKSELAAETRKAVSQRDRIQRLQNDLIKNKREKELLKLQRVQQQQEEEEDVQRHKGCSAKIANLEATVKQQRQIIEEMGRALALRQGNEKSGETEHRKEEVESAVAAENARLRKELDRLQRRPAIMQPSGQGSGSDSLRQKGREKRPKPE